MLAWRRPLWYLEQCRARLGPRFTLETLDHPPLVFLSDPDEVRAVLSAPANVLHPGEGGAAIMPIVGERSFMLLERNEHLSGRRSVGPAFQRKLIAEHARLVAEVAERELASWPCDRPAPLHPRLRAITLEVILRVIFGDASDRQIRLLRQRILSLMEVNAGVVLTEPRLRQTPRGRQAWRRFLRERAEVDALILARVEARRRGGEGGDDVLGLLLRASNPDGSAMGDWQIRDNVMSVVLAGHETTASALAWAFQLLAHHPHVQSRLREELDGGAGEDYLEATVREVLRHRPVFLFAIPRAVKQVFETADWTYDPPAHLLGCMYLLHHDPSLGDPYRFRPERYLEGSPPSWLPWGGGRKICPGRHIAWQELRGVLRGALARFEILPAQRELERACWRGVIVTPNGGARVRLRKRR